MTKKFYQIVGAAILSASLVLNFAGSALAVEPRSEDATTNNDSENIPATFEVQDHSEQSATIRLGNNLLSAGVSLQSAVETDNLLFTLGNSVDDKSKSEYNFAAGNNYNFSGQTKKDLFIAGNLVNITKDAKIGRDIYAAGNLITVDGTTIDGDFSAVASKVTFKNVTISGNINLDVSEVEFIGDIEIAGTLTYNDNAVLVGSENLDKNLETSTYHNPEHQTTASEKLLNEFMSVGSQFILALILFLAFPALKERVKKQTSGAAIGKALLNGVVCLLAIPLIALTCFISIIAAPAGIILIAVYIILLFLSFVFAGAWLGHILVSKIFKSQLPILAETLIGLLLFGIAGFIPGINSLAALFGVVIGLGVFYNSLHTGKKNKLEADAKTDSASSKKNLKNSSAKDAAENSTNKKNAAQDSASGKNTAGNSTNEKNTTESSSAKKNNDAESSSAKKVQK